VAFSTKNSGGFFRERQSNKYYKIFTPLFISSAKGFPVIKSPSHTFSLDAVRFKGISSIQRLIISE
jgi:hypothetical protein